MKVKAITGNSGQPFRYYVNIDTNVAHARRTCSNLGSNGTAGSNVLRDANPDADACSKCVPAKCLADDE